MKFEETKTCIDVTNDNFFAYRGAFGQGHDSIPDNVPKAVSPHARIIYKVSQREIASYSHVLLKHESEGPRHQVALHGSGVSRDLTIEVQIHWWLSRIRQEFDGFDPTISIERHGQLFDPTVIDTLLYPGLRLTLNQTFTQKLTKVTHDSICQTTIHGKTLPRRMKTCRGKPSKD